MNNIIEQQVRDYLMANPDWLEQQEDLHFSGRTKVKDFREAQLVKMQADNQILSRRQQQWLEALKTNEKLSRTLWNSAAHLARAHAYKAVKSELDDLLFNVLDFPAYALKLTMPHNKRPVPQAWQNENDVVVADIKTYSHLPISMNTWFDQSYASFLVLPIVYQSDYLGVWVVAATQENYFNAQLDTAYLQAYVQVLGATLARMMGVTPSC